MARGRGRRDAHDIANGTLRDLLGPDTPESPISDRVISIEDRRRDHPEVSPDPRTWRGKPAQQVPARVSKTYDGRPAKAWGQYNQLAFSTPREVLICVRRKQRKEVLHAKGKAGGKVRPPRRGPWSHVHCRRR